MSFDEACMVAALSRHSGTPHGRISKEQDVKSFIRIWVRSHKFWPLRCPKQAL
jgi:hypothetical protein